MSRLRSQRGQILPLTALCVTVLVGLAAIALDASQDRTAAAMGQTAVDAAAQSATQVWSSPTPTGAPTLLATPTTAALQRAQQVAYLNGVLTSINDYCVSAGDIVYYDIVPLSNHSCASNSAPPSGWKYSLEVRIPPTGTIPTACSPTYMCVQVVGKQVAINRLGAAVGQGSTTITYAAIALTGGSSSSYTGQGIITSLACPAANDCWGVGYYSTTASGTGPFQTFIEHWDGTSWTVTNSPNPPVPHPWSFGNRLYGVACADTSDCWAVGYYSGTSAFQTLVLKWDSVTSTWGIATPTSSNTSASQYNVLYSVTCSDASHCWAAGEYINAGGYSQALVLQYDSTHSWTVSPVNAAAAYSTLDYTFGGPLGNAPGGSGGTSIGNAVSCTSNTNCWAVGRYYNPADIVDPIPPNQTVIGYYNGIQWSIVPSPDSNPLNVPSDTDNLNAVTCFDASHCWAVGDYTSSLNGNKTRTLIEQYNPVTTNWNIVAALATPNTPNTPNGNYGDNGSLGSVTCMAVNNCYAVGSTGFYPGPVLKDLSLQYNGTNWNLIDGDAFTYISGLPSIRTVVCPPLSPIYLCWGIGGADFVYIRTVSSGGDGWRWLQDPLQNVASVTTTTSSSYGSANQPDPLVA